MKEIGIPEEQYFYHCENYAGSIFPFTKNYVHFHEQGIYFDYIIFYNNPMKYSLQKEKSDSYKITQLASNICFVNVLYAERKVVEKKYVELPDLIIYPDTNKDVFFFVNH